MPTLAYPIDPDGLIVDVLVNLEAATLVPLRASAGTRPPILARGLIDTASNASGVSPALLAQLGLSPIGPPVLTTGVGGSLSVYLYRVSLHVREANSPNLPMFTLPFVEVMGFAPGPSCEVLLGMDVLRHLKMVVDGPGNCFTIEF